MATTTAAAIRAVMVAAVKALRPATISQSRFEQHDEKIEIRRWALQSPVGSLRRFSIRDDGDLQGTGGDTGQEWVTATFEVVIAYPTDYRYGAAAEGQLALHNTIERDLAQIDRTIGTSGFALYGDGAVITDRRGREDTDAVSFGVLTLKVSFWRVP